MKDSRLMFTDGELPPEDDNPATDAADTGERITELSVWHNRPEVKKKQSEKSKSDGGSDTHLKQKQSVKKRYAAKSRENAEKTAEKTAEAAEKAARAVEEASKKIGEFIKTHWKGIAIVGAIALLLVFLTSVFSTCTAFAGCMGGVVSESSYSAEEADLLDAEALYFSLEEELWEMIAEYSESGTYDEVIYDLENIGHDPYALAAILSAVYPEGWTLDSARGVIETIFWKEYRLSGNMRYETRYRTVSIPDPPYTVQEPYRFSICTVSLQNHDLPEVAKAYLTPDQYERFTILMETHGLRSDLFSGQCHAVRKEEYEKKGQRSTYFKTPEDEE